MARRERRHAGAVRAAARGPCAHGACGVIAVARRAVSERAAERELQRFGAVVVFLLISGVERLMMIGPTGACHLNERPAEARSSPASNASKSSNTLPTSTNAENCVESSPRLMNGVGKIISDVPTVLSAPPSGWHAVALHGARSHGPSVLSSKPRTRVDGAAGVEVLEERQDFAHCRSRRRSRCRPRPGRSPSSCSGK